MSSRFFYVKGRFKRLRRKMKKILQFVLWFGNL
jgi:hypothetical protein